MEALDTTDELKGRELDVQLAIVGCVSVALLALLVRHALRDGSAFWDARVYLRAILAFRNGADPYQHYSQLNFVNPPLFLRLGSMLYGALPLKLLAWLYLGLNTAAALSIPVVLARGYLRCRWLSVATAMVIFLVHPLMTAETAILSGNISSLLYGIILLAGVPGVRRGRWIWFYVAVGGAAMLKLPLLAMLLLPVLAGRFRWLGSAVTVVVVGVETLTERLLWPADYHAFLDAAAFQVRVLKDSGFGTYRYFEHFNLGAHVPLLGDAVGYIAQGLVGILLLGALWRLRQLPPLDRPSRTLWIAALLVTAIVAGPRMMAYDAMVAVVPATVILVEAVGELVRRGTDALLLAVPLAGFVWLVARSGYAALFVLLLTAVLLVAGRVYPPALEAVER